MDQPSTKEASHMTTQPAVQPTIDQLLSTPFEDTVANISQGLWSLPGIVVCWDASSYSWLALEDPTATEDDDLDVDAPGNFHTTEALVEHLTTTDRPFDLLKYTEQVVHDSAGGFEPADPSGDLSPAEVDTLDVEALLTLLDLQLVDPPLHATSGQELALALLAYRSERQPHGHVGPCTAAVLSHLFQVDRATDLTARTITQLITDLPSLAMTR
jgi:hypothetical protein